MKRFFFVVLALAAASLNASAQDFRGAITGRILDSSNARLPGVTVTATNVATNVASTTTTNGEGDYSILFLNPGTYTVTAELSGFKKVSRPGVQVSIGDKLDVSLTLDVGRMEETVSVTAESPLLATTSRIDRTGHRREDDRDDAAVRRQPVRAGAPGARHHLQRRPEVLAAVRQRRHVGHRRPAARPAATSSRSTARRTWPTAAASRSCRRPAPCRSSRSRPRASTRAAGTPPARRST